ncbi:MlaD family protein [Nocardioides antri]|uniref:MCE family protein n=1 Tax=Nocardioides antri TaxID=2607659 RepID=A0A5B1M918_9ACTN|nr:MlaD family protein [Nocardioides antri]KAA1429124.1 MCE family protein [Nocardioides antri]
MSRGVRIRLVAFIILSAVGISYITATYLGLVDRITGSGHTVTATLPGSGGLFEGSEVTYRGVKIGKVTEMTPTAEGIELQLAITEDTKLPTDSKMYVHNLSAVGEQYLDFQPPDEDGPYAEDGTVFHGDESSLPVDETDLLIDLDEFVQSVDKRDLQVLVEELGVLFGDTGRDLQAMLDNGSAFIEEASAHTDETIALLQNGLTVLRTQQGQKENIRSFARDLATLTAALRGSDKDLRKVLTSTPGAARELQAMLEQLEPTLPVLLSDLIAVDQVVLANLDGLEQLLVTYPVLIAGGPTGSTRDGWGHVNLQFDNDVPPCTQGYLPPSRHRSPHNLTDKPYFHAECKSGPPYVMRGPKYVPARRGNASVPRVYSGTYDPVTGEVPGVRDDAGRQVRFRQTGNLSVLGGDAWKWLLVGPVAR